MMTRSIENRQFQNLCLSRFSYFFTNGEINCVLCFSRCTSQFTPKEHRPTRRQPGLPGTSTWPLPRHQLALPMLHRRENRFQSMWTDRDCADYQIRRYSSSTLVASCNHAFGRDLGGSCKSTLVSSFTQLCIVYVFLCTDSQNTSFWHWFRVNGKNRAPKWGAVWKEVFAKTHVPFCVVFSTEPEFPSLRGILLLRLIIIIV